MTDLGSGEAEVIALGLETPGCLVVLDDRLARRVAGLCRLELTGTLGILVRARREGLVPCLGDVIERLRDNGMWLGEGVVAAALRLAGER
jgi:hypothetical protein